jgi:pimeloyl-ACP methyl ester carboxylesterase
VGIPLAGALSARRPLPSLTELESVSIPVLLVAGDGDEFCPLHDLHDLAGWLPAAHTLVVEGTDHFFSRREREVAEGIGGWVNGALAAQ